jgi:hypothetical protein
MSSNFESVNPDEDIKKHTRDGAFRKGLRTLRVPIVIYIISIYAD